MRYIDFSSVKETIGKIYFGICICVFAYAVIGVHILLGMLKKHGVKTEAVITPNTSSWVHRYTTNCNICSWWMGRCLGWSQIGLYGRYIYWIRCWWSR